METKLKINPVEYGLKTFYKFKYQNKKLKYSAVPKILDAISYLESWLSCYDEETQEIEYGELFKLSNLLKQYFRTEFLVCVDRKSITQYFESKYYLGYDSLIKIELSEHPEFNQEEHLEWLKDRDKNTFNLDEIDFLEPEKSEYFKWLQGKNRQILKLEKYDMYNDLNEANIIRGISIDSFKIHEIRSLLKEYFVSKLELIFAQFHVKEKFCSIKTFEKGIVGSSNLKRDKTADSLENIKKEENKFRKGIPMKDVIDHFKPLTTTNSKNGQPFLTEPQFIKFLQRAFLGKIEIEKQKINLTNTEKGLVVLLFYEFFQIAVHNYSEPNRKKDFVNLIVNHFANNWTHSSVYDLLKRGKIVKKW